MLTSGRLNEYLASVDEQAEDVCSWLVKDNVNQQEVIEKIKVENQIEWVCIKQWAVVMPAEKIQKQSYTIDFWTKYGILSIRLEGFDCKKILADYFFSRYTIP